MSARLPSPRTLTALLGLSVFLNVLVAWGCILWSPYRTHERPPEEPMVDGYPAMIKGPGGLEAWWFTSRGFGVMEAVPSGARGAEGRFLYWRGRHTPAHYLGGWPLHSMQSVVKSHDNLARWDLPLREIVRRGLQTSELPAWMKAHEGRRLPFMPRWTGFFVNTACYFSLVLGISCFCVRLENRSLRQQVGHC